MYRFFFKRIFDLVCSLIALVLLLPLLFIVALLVRINLGSPVIFKQERVGKNDKIFTLRKFKSMTNEKGEDGNLLPDEARLTKFGKFLRSTSLDELPELVNIIKGDMSMVGPRPLLVDYLPLYDELQRHRHDVKPGLTGLAQVNGRNAMDWDKRLEYDIEYIKKITAFKDIKIIFKTVLIVTRRSGISADTSVVIQPPVLKEEVYTNENFTAINQSAAENFASK